MPHPERLMVLESMQIRGHHVHRLIVSHDGSRWKVQEETDSTLVRQTQLSDWHRVERAVRRFERTPAAYDALTESSTALSPLLMRT